MRRASRFRGNRPQESAQVPLHPPESTQRHSSTPLGGQNLAVDATLTNTNQSNALSVKNGPIARYGGT